MNFLFYYIKAFINAFQSLALNEQLPLSLFGLLFLYFFIRLILKDINFRLFVWKFIKKCIYLMFVSFIIYNFLNNSIICEIPTKTLVENFCDNKKIVSFVLISGLTISGIYLYKNYYSKVDPFLETIKKREAFLDIEMNHNKLCSLYNNYLRNKNIKFENTFVTRLPYCVEKLEKHNIHLKHDLAIFNSIHLSDIQFYSSLFFSQSSRYYDLELQKLSNDRLKSYISVNQFSVVFKGSPIFKEIDSQKLTIENIKSIADSQLIVNLELNLLTSNTIYHNKISGWLDTKKIIESSNIIADQYHFFDTICKYSDLLKELPISKICNNIIYKSEDLLIISGYIFFSVTSLFTYSGNPIPYEYFIRSFYRLFKL